MNENDCDCYTWATADMSLMVRGNGHNPACEHFKEARMKSEIKKKWVEALKSDKYQQGTGTLRSYNNEYCCLGVLCDLHSRECSGLSWIESEYANVHYTYGNKTGSLPVEVMKWSGVSFEAEGILMSMNDVENRSFSEIAEFVDKNL